MAQTERLYTPQAYSHTREANEVTAKEGLASYFEQLRNHDGITLPYQEHESPRKRRKSPGHDAVRLISLLYYQQNFESLEQAIAQSRLRSPARVSIDDKLNHLLESLKLAASPAKNGTPHSPRRQWQVAPSLPGSEHQHVQATSMGPPPIPTWSKPPPPPGSASSFWPPPSLESTEIDDCIDTPPSPTPSIRHAPKQSLDDISYPNLPPPIRSTSPVTVLYDPRAMAPPPKLDLTKIMSGTTSVNTSFTTTSANTSFQSEAQGFQEAETPASSVGSLQSMDGPKDATNGLCTQQTNWGSSPSSSVFERLCGSAAPTSTEYTKWGSSIPDDDFPDEAQTPCKRQKLGSSTNVRLDEEMDCTPARTTTTPPVAKENEKPMPVDSPEKRNGENRRVRDIPRHGIACGVFMTGQLSDLSFELQWECTRLMQSGNITTEQLDEEWGYRSFTSLEKFQKLHVPHHSFRSEAAYKDCSYHAKLRWRDAKEKDKPLFKLELLPPSHENHNSWQRKYGSKRFIFVEVDNLNKPPMKSELGNQEHITTRFLEMLSEPQELLGRRWLQFHAQQKKSNNKSSNPEDARSGIMQYIFAAISSSSREQLLPLTLRDIIGWSIPFTWNMDKSWCKASSRLDLYASRPVPIVVLQPNDVAYIDDEYATRDPPDERFNDERFGKEHADNEVYYADTLMTDGCSVAHPYLFHLIAKKLELKRIPSVAQFRFAGAKGLVSIMRIDRSQPFDPNVRPEGPLIWIRKSQLKVEPGDDNKDPAKYDRDYWMLQVVKVSHPTPPWLLYRDFMPILRDRGIPSRVIEDIALRSAKAIAEEFLQCLEDPQKLRDWIRRANAAAEDLRRANGMRMLAGFPKARLERAVRMLESGFEPLKFKPLAKDIEYSAHAIFERKKKTFKITLDNSTNLLGIADPTGALAPGEIYYQTSEPFNDPITSMQTTCLEGEVLVSRAPAGRPSDMQKVRAVRKPELDHLYDVVVFSSKGPRALADHLSGGDYDGDIFWVCWDSRLVAPFKNAPAPQRLPNPTTLGIEVDERRLREIVVDPNNEHYIEEFIRMATKNRLRFNQLGTVTKMLLRVVHADGFYSQRAKALMDLKDLIMDSDKNGRFFSEKAWRIFKEKYRLSSLLSPAHCEYTDPASEDQLNAPKYDAISDDDILDKICFGVLGETFDAALATAESLLSKAIPDDVDLVRLYDKIGRRGKRFRRELDLLKSKLQKVQDQWTRAMTSWQNLTVPSEKTKALDAAVLACRKDWESIQPEIVSQDTILEWTEQIAYEPTTWTQIKASAMALELTANEKKMWFQIAAPELCYMKASATPGSVLLTRQAHMALKPREWKFMPTVHDDDNDAKSDYGEDLSLEDLDELESPGK